MCGRVSSRLTHSFQAVANIEYPPPGSLHNQYLPRYVILSRTNIFDNYLPLLAQPAPSAPRRRRSGRRAALVRALALLGLTVCDVVRR